MINWPKPWTGLFNPMVAWINKMLAACKQCEPVSIEGYNIEFTSNGFKARKKFTTTGGGVSTPAIADKLMIITALGSALTPPNYDLLICREWSALTNSFVNATDVYVAKKLVARRGIAKEYYLDNGDNLIQTYTYFGPTVADATFGDNFRMGTDGTNPELQVMEKRYITQGQLIAGGPDVLNRQALIYAKETSAPTGVKDPNGKDVTKVESEPFRAWTRYATQ